VFHYFCSTPYDAAADKGIRWDDPALAIDWPVAAPELSAKDRVAPLLSALAEDALPSL
jgi:dTDP-4-dehydrorhamnose 3,5-epimerase